MQWETPGLMIHTRPGGPSRDQKRRKGVSRLGEEGVCLVWFSFLFFVFFFFLILFWKRNQKGPPSSL